MALAGSFALSALGGCFVDKGYSYWVLNDTDLQLIVDVRVQFHRTYLVAPHTYGGLFGGLGGEMPIDEWTLHLVDEQCEPQQTWTIDGDHNLLYVDPTGQGELVNDLAWSHGLRTAESATLTQRDPACP